VELAAFQGYAANWTGEGESERLEGIAATSSYLPVLGMTTRVGRWFLEEEQYSGGHRVVVLSETLWKTRFAEDREIAGRDLVLNGEVFSVVGVASGGLTIPAAPDLWVPLVIDPKSSRGNRQYTVIGRLRPGFSAEQAQAEMSAIAAGLESQYPESNRGWNVSVVPLMHWLVSAEIRGALQVLLVAVILVLFVACANVANLLLARAEARRKEMAIRAALGAGAAKIFRQILSESLLLSFAGGVFGVAFSYGIVAVARSSLAGIVPRANEISMDLSVLGFAFGLALITGLFFGLTPIVRLGRMRNLAEYYRTGRTSQISPRSRFRSALVVAQLSIATLLVIGAGLLLQSLARLHASQLGLEPDSVLTARVSLPRARYADGGSISLLFSQLTDALQSAPGVEAAGISSAIPMGPGSTTGGEIEAVAPNDASVVQSLNSQWRSVDAGFFAALRIPLLRGRLFGAEDGPGRCCVFVLGLQAARSLFGDADPIGRRIRLNDTTGEVIGVVGDIPIRGIAYPPESVVYLPLSQGGRFAVFALFLRTRDGSTEAAAALIRAKLREIDSALPPFGFRAMNDWVDGTSARNRIVTWVVTLLAVVALALGIIGVYGVLAYLVALRRHEFGVRLALGARPGNLLGLVLAQGLGLSAIGIGVGLGGAFMLTGILESLLFGVNTRDPMTFLAVALLLLTAALAASYAPARRAARSDPMAVLRAE
jgi:predicted permease